MSGSSRPAPPPACPMPRPRHRAPSPLGPRQLGIPPPSFEDSVLATAASARAYVAAYSSAAFSFAAPVGDSSVMGHDDIVPPAEGSLAAFLLIKKKM